MTELDGENHKSALATPSSSGTPESTRSDPRAGRASGEELAAAEAALRRHLRRHFRLRSLPHWFTQLVAQVLIPLLALLTALQAVRMQPRLLKQALEQDRELKREEIGFHAKREIQPVLLNALEIQLDAAVRAGSDPKRPPKWRAAWRFATETPADVQSRIRQKVRELNPLLSEPNRKWLEGRIAALDRLALQISQRPPLELEKTRTTTRELFGVERVGDYMAELKAFEEQLHAILFPGQSIISPIDVPVPTRNPRYPS